MTRRPSATASNPDNQERNARPSERGHSSLAQGDVISGFEDLDGTDYADTPIGDRNGNSIPRRLRLEAIRRSLPPHGQPLRHKPPNSDPCLSRQSSRCRSLPASARSVLRLSKAPLNRLALKCRSAHRRTEPQGAPRLADTCGSGDWCTTGLIAKAAYGGRKGLCRAGAGGVRAALRYGQTLAAWNCGFEGARGGMYSVSREAFGDQIASLRNGRFEGIDDAPVASVSSHVVTCPRCPPAPGVHEAVSHP